MKLSGHSYTNDVMASLLNGIKGDVVYTKAAQTNNKPQGQITGMNIFSSTTEDDMRVVQSEELRDIVGELEFAADRAHVALSREHMIRFAKEVMNEKLRGKKLERAAQKFCSRIASETAAPMGDTRNSFSSSLLENAGNHAVIPAGYNPEYGQNDSKTGGFMGQSKNPNTIWDSGKLAELATQPRGDEQIKQSKKAQEEFAKNQKQQYWEELQAKMSQSGIIHEKTASVANVSTVEGVGNQSMPKNSMDIWGNNGFDSLPEETEGESLKTSSEQRSMKKDAARAEWDKSEPAKKAVSHIFDEVLGQSGQKQNTHRASVDKLFEGLADYYNGK